MTTTKEDKMSENDPSLLGKSELSVHDELLDRVITAYNLEDEEADPEHAVTNSDSAKRIESAINKS